MLRLASSVLLGFVMIYIQAVLVMHFNGSSTVRFNESAWFFLMWFMNTAVAFTLLTQLKNGLQKIKQNHLELWQKWIETK